MVMSHRSADMGKSIPAGLALGWISEMICLLGCCILLSVLVLGGRVKMEMSGYGIMVTLLLCSYIGAAVSGGLIKQRRLLVSFLSGLIFILTIIIGLTFFFDAQYDAVGVSSLLVLAGSMVSALLCGTGKGRRSTKIGKRKR